MTTIRGGRALEQKLAAISRAVGGKARTLRVGFLEGRRYPDGKPVAMIAAIQNFGAPRAGIPPRPFFSNMVKDKSREWPGALRQQLVDNDYDAKKSLDALGHGIAGQLRQSIQDTNSPPLKPATIRRKGFAKPLIDTHWMYDSVDFEVES